MKPYQYQYWDQYQQAVQQQMQSSPYLPNGGFSGLNSAFATASGTFTNNTISWNQPGQFMTDGTNWIKWPQANGHDRWIDDRLFDVGPPVQHMAKPPEGSNAKWLDNRVQEMRVKL